MLMLYLTTRSRLWPHATRCWRACGQTRHPRSAVNSLHQTLFHLRRDIEPWYDEGCTAAYVRMESDMVFLDTEMFQIDSVAFNRQAADILKSGTARDRGPEMLGYTEAGSRLSSSTKSGPTHGGPSSTARTSTSRTARRSALVREGRYSETVESCSRSCWLIPWPLTSVDSRCLLRSHGVPKTRHLLTTGASPSCTCAILASQRRHTTKSWGGSANDCQPSTH